MNIFVIVVGTFRASVLVPIGAIAGLTSGTQPCPYSTCLYASTTGTSAACARRPTLPLQRRLPKPNNAPAASQLCNAVPGWTWTRMPVSSLFLLTFSFKQRCPQFPSINPQTSPHPILRIPPSLTLPSPWFSLAQ